MNDGFLSKEDWDSLRIDLKELIIASCKIIREYGYKPLVNDTQTNLIIWIHTNYQIQINKNQQRAFPLRFYVKGRCHNLYHPSRYSYREVYRNCDYEYYLNNEELRVFIKLVIEYVDEKIKRTAEILKLDTM